MSAAEDNKGPELSFEDAVAWAKGSPTLLSELCGLHVQTVWSWKKKGRIPMGWRYWLLEQMKQYDFD